MGLEWESRAQTRLPFCMARLFSGHSFLMGQVGRVDVKFLRWFPALKPGAPCEQSCGLSHAALGGREVQAHPPTHGVTRAHVAFSGKSGPSPLPPVHCWEHSEPLRGALGLPCGGRAVLPGDLSGHSCPAAPVVTELPRPWSPCSSGLFPSLRPAEGSLEPAVDP